MLFPKKGIHRSLLTLYSNNSNGSDNIKSNKNERKNLLRPCLFFCFLGFLLPLCFATSRSPCALAYPLSRSRSLSRSLIFHSPWLHSPAIPFRLRTHSPCGQFAVRTQCKRRRTTKQKKKTKKKSHRIGQTERATVNS